MTQAKEIFAILSRELNNDLLAVPRSSRLREDLGMDSIVALNIMFALERDLGVRIQEEDIVGVRTVADLEILVGRIASSEALC